MTLVPKCVFTILQFGAPAARFVAPARVLCMALFVHTTVNTKEALINYVVRLHVVILQIESGGNWRFNHEYRPP
jgi:hypothetical protein